MIDMFHKNYKLPNITAIFPAAGIGKRMNSIVPKQYCVIGKKTVIEYSIRIFLHQSYICHCIVVINNSDRWFRNLSIANNSKIKVVIGGQTRADSVMAGLKYVKNSSWVITHDAVRPCLHIIDLLRLLRIIRFSKVGGVLAIPISNTIKCSYTKSNLVHHTVDRRNLWYSLTPQLFNKSLLKFCLKKALKNNVNVTDESSAIEYCGYNVILVQGRSDNIKITYQEDLKLANFYLSNDITQ